MPRPGLRVPTGFSILGGLILPEVAHLGSMSSREIEAINQGEDLVCAEHLLLNASVHLDALAEAFVITILTTAGEQISRRTAMTFQEAVDEFENTLQRIWSFNAPWRETDATYRADQHGVSTNVGDWGVSGGWTVLLDSLSGEASRVTHTAVGVGPMAAVFAAISSHRSIAVYEIKHASAPAAYAGLLWAEPTGMFYERVFLADPESVAAWLHARLSQAPLPRRRKRK